jgi:hypothetical protein
MIISIDIDETQVTPQSLKALAKYLDSRGEEELRKAVKRLYDRTEHGVSVAKANGTYMK